MDGMYTVIAIALVTIFFIEVLLQYVRRRSGTKRQSEETKASLKEIEEREKALTEALKELEEQDKRIKEAFQVIGTTFDELKEENRLRLEYIEDGRVYLEPMVNSLFDIAHDDLAATIKKNAELAELEKARLLKDYAALAEQAKLETDLVKAELQTEMDSIQAKFKALNEAIALEEKMRIDHEFYTINLKEEDKEDIEFLLDINKKMNNRDLIGKLVWSTFFLPAVNDMERRVLGGRAFPGVYKITDEHGRAYIGKSTNIKARWQDHIKASLGIGTIASYSIHEALRDKGWDTFTFQVLEETTREELTEREKYYITFYETNVYGYNKKVG